MNPGRKYFGANPLMWSSARGDVSEMKRHLAEGFDVNDMNDHKQTALVYAAGAGSSDAVSLLVQSGALVDHKDRFGATPLIYAANKGHTEVVRQLIQHGADLEIANTLDKQTTFIGDLRNVFRRKSGNGNTWRQ